MGNITTGFYAVEVCGYAALLLPAGINRHLCEREDKTMYDIFEKLKGLNTKPVVTGTPEFLVIGLGNPEPKYDITRHNAGFMAIDRIAKKVNCKIDQLKFKSLCGMCEIEGKKVMLVKPSTYMNNSGEAVREVSQFYKISPDHIIIIFDDISLDVGKMRLRRKGTHGGHNGIKSIIYLTGSDQFPRIKIGVGQKPHPDYDLADWVLGKFSEEDLKNLDPILDNSYEAVKLIVSGKMDRAMNLYN